jgi:hypothetical protein
MSPFFPLSRVRTTRRPAYDVSETSTAAMPVGTAFMSGPRQYLPELDLVTNATPTIFVFSAPAAPCPLAN